jgi:hypothetical protein
MAWVRRDDVISLPIVNPYSFSRQVVGHVDVSAASNFRVSHIELVSKLGP